MTRDDFIRQIIKLRHSFVGRFEVGDANIETWFKFLGRYDSDVFEYAVNEWIMRERTAPSIAELRKYAFDAKEKKSAHPEQWELEKKQQWDKMVE